jgi:mannosyl-oligosaccharide glucosidase
MHHLRLSLILTSLLAALGVLAVHDPDIVSVLVKEAARANNESLLWGPYKPNLYFGVRPRISNSLSAGLVWAKLDSLESVQHSMVFPKAFTNQTDC